MRALLLAAGLGTRLRPLTDTVPKCLVEIDGRPLLDHWLDLLSRGGITDVLINLHHLPDAVEEYLARARYPVRVRTVFEEQLLLTGGTILVNQAYFEGQPFMVVHADNLSLFDVDAFMKTFESRRPGIEITMMTFATDMPETCGIVELDSFGTVKAFHEKVASPPGKLANGAVYIFSSEVLRFMNGLGKQMIDVSTEVLPAFLGRINTFHNDVYHRDIGNINSLMLARNEYPGAAARFKPFPGRPA